MSLNLAQIGYRKAAKSYRYNQPFNDTAIASLPAPQIGFQEQFLESEATITIGGGAAGSGKTLAALLDLAKPELLKNPHYRAIVLRRSFPQISNPGGLLDASKRLYYNIGGKLTKNPLDWTFPSGAKIGLRHLQYEDTVYDHQGAEYARILFEEGTQFSREQFLYLLSRLRSTSGIVPKVKLTCNPEAESWLADFISWWIDPETGYAIKERSGAIRWFVNINDAIAWADTPDALIEQFGSETEPLSVTFIPGNIQENQALLSINPQYIANLKALHPVEQERLLKGNWKIKYERGTVFDRTWFKIVDTLPDKPARKVRFWDFAATAKEVATNTSCYTSGLGMAEIGEDYYVFDNIVDQRKAGDVEILVKSVANMDGQRVKVRWEKEGGSSGVMVENSLKSLIHADHPSFDLAAVSPQGDKLTRALPVAQAAAAGRVYLVRGSWNNRFLNAVESFDGSSKTEPPINDIVDSLSGAYNLLTIEVEIVFSDPVGSVKKMRSRH
jgi:predicted phage terminase large subunit-like protein